MREAREKLESEMEDAYHEHQANLLRQGKFSGGVVRLEKETMVCSCATMTSVGFMSSFRSAQATGGTAAHGGVAQSGDAEEEGDAAQVFMFIRILFGCWSIWSSSHKHNMPSIVLF